MCICETNKIDRMSLYEESSKCLWLDIDDELTWDDIDDHLLKLQAKINAYVYYIESKEYINMYPLDKFKFEVFIIQLNFLYKPIDECINFLIQVGQFFREKNKKKKEIIIRFLMDLSTID